MKDPVLKLQLLARTEMALGRIQAQRAGTRITLSLIALVFVLLGLGMLNFSGYQAFVVRFSPALSGLFIALIDICVAVIIFILAGRTSGESNEEKMAKDIRDLAYSELNADVDVLKAEFARVSSDVHRIRSGFSAFRGGSAGGLGGIVPLLGLLTKAVKKNKK